MVFTRAYRQGRSKAIRPSNREWATAIICVNGEVWTLPLFLLLQGAFDIENWYTKSSYHAIGLSKLQAAVGQITIRVLNGLSTSKSILQARSKRAYRMVILSGHESHHSADFETYCKEKNIIALCLPAHTSHLTQPLDIGCFSTLNALMARKSTRLSKPI